MAVYLDNSATTKPCSGCVDAVNEMLINEWGNPSSLHSAGIAGKKKLIGARSAVAALLHCDKAEIYFTSGGTEANNTAVLGAADALKRRGHRIVTTAIEHESVLESAKELERRGFDVVFLQPDKHGMINENDLLAAVNQDTILVSMMYVNNEVGSILPVEKIKAAILRAGAPALVHVDCVQAFGKIDVSPKKLGADLLTVSAHKVHGPKGVGALYVRQGVRVLPRLFGGEQEKRLRPGTEASPLIAGFGAAVSQIGNLNEQLLKTTQISEYAKEKLLAIDGVKLNSPQGALPYIINIYIPTFLRSQTIVQELSSNYGIYVSNGSACAGGKKSHVLSAMRLGDEIIDKSIRISFSRYNTKGDADLLAEAIKNIVQKYPKAL
ncbi:MAG: cysteine desulfurase [Clostridiales bacterium]|nr:cysteine desulfurase [Clostridiales bacterium]